MISDLIVACRGLRPSAAFTVAAIATLALGIGANTTMFTVVTNWCHAGSRLAPA